MQTILPLCAAFAAQQAEGLLVCFNFRGREE